METPVRLEGTRAPEQDDLLRQLMADADTARVGGVSSAVAFAAQCADVVPTPGHGRTLLLWECLASVAAVDLQVARALEPHLDALAILSEAGVSAPRSSTWGVYAAEGAGQRLRARAAGTGWLLDGTKPWCSLAAHLSHALVTAWIDEDERRLFSVDLAEDGVQRGPGTWEARGLRDIDSSPVTFTGVPAAPVGQPGWYLSRLGFAWGGIGVAAIWYGGAVAVARRLRAAAMARDPDQIGLMHLGAVDAVLAAARSSLVRAAADVDADRGAGAEGVVLALRTRQVVFDAAETVLRSADHALGPAPLVTEARHAARVVDLHLYLRQHHAERDTAALGRRVLEGDEPW